VQFYIREFTHTRLKQNQVRARVSVFTRGCTKT
jgi:hypothetical protein